MAPPQEQTTPTAKNASPQRSQVESKWGRRIGGAVFLGLAIALHSLAFVVPWPESEVVEEPEPEVVLEPDPPAISISRLPPVAPDPEAKAAETTEKSTLPNQASRQPEQPTPAPTENPPPRLDSEIQEITETLESSDNDEHASEDDANHSATGGSSGEPTLDERIIDPSSYVRNDQPIITQGITILAALEAFKAEQPDAESITGKYNTRNNPDQNFPISACVPPSEPPPAEGIVGVVLDVNNEIIGGPEVIATSGYDVSDEKAQEVAGHPDIIEKLKAIDPTARPTLFALKFTVNYDESICASPQP